MLGDTFTELSHDRVSFGAVFGTGVCATALLGLKRNLTASEIVDQILEASRTLREDQRITHVVLMGMGEPLANYAQTTKALEIIHKELDLTMAFCGRTDINTVDQSILLPGTFPTV